jgi:ribosomal protein S27E
MPFLKVKCKNCKHKQIVNETASTIVKCNKCNVTMQKPTGGKAQTRAEVLEALE